MTIKELTASVKGAVTSGLNGVGNHNLSSSQIEKDSVALRNEIIVKKEISGILDVNAFAQTIDAIPMTLKPMSTNSTVHTIERYKHFEVPRLLSGIYSKCITHLGPIDKSESLQYQLGGNYKTFKYRPIGGNSPFIWIDTTLNENDAQDCWLITQEAFRPLKFVSITAIFEDPIAVDEMKKLGDSMGTGLGQKDSREFPAPSEVQSLIIKELTSRYVQLYHKRNLPPMTQDGLKQ